MTDQIRYFVAYGLAGYGPSGEDGYTCANSWRDLADIVGRYLRESAEEELELAFILGDDQEDYEDAWLTFKRSEDLRIMAMNLDNDRAEAPLYQGNLQAWDKTIEGIIGENFPLDVSDNTRLYVWPADDDEAWAQHTEED